jgi:hypothetical protein
MGCLAVSDFTSFFTGNPDYEFFNYSGEIDLRGVGISHTTTATNASGGVIITVSKNTTGHRIEDCTISNQTLKIETSSANVLVTNTVVHSKSSIDAVTVNTATNVTLQNMLVVGG